MEWRQFYEDKGTHSSCSEPPNSPWRIWRAFRRRRLSHVLDPLPARYSLRSMLDVGSEEGFLTKRMASAGVQVTSLDLSRNRLLQSRGEGKASNVAFVQGDGGRLPFSDRAFDLVVAADIIEHIPAYEVAISECARVTKTCLLISTNLDGLHRRLARSIGLKALVEREDEKVGHLHIFPHPRFLNTIKTHWGDLALVGQDMVCTTPPFIAALSLGGFIRGRVLSRMIDLVNALPKVSRLCFANWVVVVGIKADAVS